MDYRLSAAYVNTTELDRIRTRLMDIVWRRTGFHHTVKRIGACGPAQVGGIGPEDPVALNYGQKAATLLKAANSATQEGAIMRANLEQQRRAHPPEAQLPPVATGGQEGLAMHPRGQHQWHLVCNRRIGDATIREICQDARLPRDMLNEGAINWNDANFAALRDSLASTILRAASTPHPRQLDSLCRVSRDAMSMWAERRMTHAP